MCCAGRNQYVGQSEDFQRDTVFVMVSKSEEWTTVDVDSDEE